MNVCLQLEIIAATSLLEYSIFSSYKFISTEILCRIPKNLKFDEIYLIGMVKDKKGKQKKVKAKRVGDNMGRILLF